ncbi:two-component system sensor histidine kinase NtrB [Halopseudomonas pachastrellae]|uniref:two-component system sensor histidine kinase NtrB n=1 Tax=Halopseudomonas pachastrellae TaxID=254161 RepID=UPI003D7C7059|tara:strand:+ start:334 stop:1926 length:1593 start_codon:yes stop_codon:yes gene_type:complete
MHTDSAERIDSQRPRILRLYNLYRVILGFGLTLLTSAALREGVLSVSDANVYAKASWIYLFINVLIALSLHRGRRDLHLFILAVLDIGLLGVIFYAAGGIGSGFGNLLIIPVAIGNVLLHGRIGLLLPALASLVLIYLTFFLSLTHPYIGQSYLQAGVLGAIYFAVAMFVQRVSRRLYLSEVLAREQAASLASMEQLNQLIIQRMRTGILVVADDHRIITRNEACTQMLGRELSSGVKLEHVSPELEQRLRQWQRNPSVRGTAFHSHSGGTELMANFKPLGETSKGSILIFLDDNTQVAQQAQQLKLASLGRLTASIAHEIRNPLGAISHAAQLLNESDLLSRQDLRLTEIIQQHSQRMNRVIETVLELSRRRPSEPQLVDLALWTSGFLQDFRAAHPLTDSIDCEIEKEGILTRIDPNQLTQVVSNLCQNALRYSGEPGSERTIYLRLYLHPDTQLPILEIIDHGPGVPSEHVGHIFEPFYTTENSGTGLGLYISRELCESNQARLECDSAQPQGCCMRITFAHPKRLV